MSEAESELKELLRQVRRLEIRTERMVDSLAAGEYRSRFKGQGMEFEEVREYTEGDDIRHIDWNVTARANKAYIKTFREERDLTVMLLVDVSGSMRFGAIPGIAPRTKQALAAEAAAIVGVTAMRNNDLIGLIAFSDTTECHLPPRKGRKHAMRVVRECLTTRTGSHATSLATALEQLLRTVKKRTVCFVISDFLTLEPDLGAMLARAGRKHDLIGMRVRDPAESELPAGAPLALVDPESKAEQVISTSRRSRRRYRDSYLAQLDHVSKCFRNSGCDLVELTTAEGAFTAVQRFFRQRRRAG